MSKATVGRDQAIQALSVLGNNVDWDQIDPVILQNKVIDNPVGIGAQFTAFLKNGGLMYPRTWREKDGVIYLSVTSNGRTGPQWIEHLGKLGFRLSDYAKSVLGSPDFTPTNGVTYEIAILKGMLFQDKDRITQKIRAEADRRKLTKPNAEVACLIRENFSDEEIEAMGLWWIVAMHEPIKGSDGDPSLLGARRHGDGRWLRVYCDGPVHRWDRGSGFAFLVSQVGPKVLAPQTS